jgi:hypothetical protein
VTGRRKLGIIVDHRDIHFAESDRAVLAELVFDPACEPSYELMKSCLVWPDERPLRISKEGYALLGDLWAVRGFLHRVVPLSQWGLDPTYFQTVWQNALVDVPEWPGFKRIDLSESDRAYLAACLKASTEGEGF